MAIDIDYLNKVLDSVSEAGLTILFGLSFFAPTDFVGF